MALKLLNDCLMQAQNNEEFLLHTEKKILSRLSILAKTRKESNDIERGALMFGKNFNQKASADFLKLLLLFLQKWANTFATYHSTGKQTEISKVYQALVKERITFPSEESFYATMTLDYQKTDRSISQSLNQSVNQNNMSMNKDQFRSYQGQPRQSQHVQSSQFNTFNKEGLVQANQFRTSAQQKNSQQLSGSRNSPMTTQLSGPQDRPGSGQHLTKEQQLQQARKVKEEYKKLNEYHSNAKLAEEILSMGGDSGGGLDEELLKQFRDQLTEGKEFSEKFLKTLMDSSFQIKDKESKINKILTIISDIGNQLKKILIFRPYSPRSLKEMEKKRKLQEDEELKSTRKEEEERASLKKSEEKKVIRKDSNDNLTPLQKKQEKYGLDVSKSVQQIPKVEHQDNDPLGFNKAKAEFNLEKQNSDIFKTNFSNVASSNLNSDNWGTNSFNNFPKQSGFSDFNFNPIQSSFEPQLSQRKNQQQEKQSPVKAFKIINPIQKSVGIVKNKQSPGNIDENENEEEVKQVKVQKVIRKTTEKVKTSSTSPNLVMPSHQSPGLLKKVSESLNNQTLDLQNDICNQEDSVKHQDLQPNTFNFPSPFKSSTKSLKSDRQLGKVLKPEGSRPQISHDSPTDANFSDDEHQIQDLHDEKSSFKFPTPSQKIAQHSSKQTFANDFSWDFNNFGKSNTNSSQNKDQPVNFGFGISPQKRQSQVKQSPKTSDIFSFEPQIRSSVNAFEELIPNRDKPQSQKKQSEFNFEEVIKESPNETIKEKKQQKQTFDFNMIDEEEQPSPVKSTHNENHQIQQLTAQVADLLDEITSLRNNVQQLQQENEDLRVKENDKTQQLKNQELKLQDLTTQLQESQDKERKLERKKLETQVKIEELETQVKLYKKYEYMYEEEQFVKAQLSNEVADLTQKLEEYRKMADRQEHQVNKKEKELDQLREQLDKVTKEHTYSVEQHERDLQDLKESEGNTKKQLQLEIFEAKTREEEARVQLKIQQEESKKREEALKIQWEKELKEVQEREKQLNNILVKEQEKAKERENEMQSMIEKLQKELENQKAQIELKDQDHTDMVLGKSQNHDPQERSTEIQKEILYGSSFETKQQILTPQTNLFNVQDQKKLIDKAEDNKSNAQLSSLKSPPFFDSMIKSQALQNQDKNGQTLHVSKFDQEEQIVILDHSPTTTLKQNSYTLDNNSLTDNKEREHSNNEDNDDDLERDYDQFDDTMPPVPSSDSDKDYEDHTNDIIRDQPKQEEQKEIFESQTETKDVQETHKEQIVDTSQKQNDQSIWDFNVKSTNEENKETMKDSFGFNFAENPLKKQQNNDETSNDLNTSIDTKQRQESNREEESVNKVNEDREAKSSNQINAEKGQNKKETDIFWSFLDKKNGDDSENKELISSSSNSQQKAEHEKVQQNANLEQSDEAQEFTVQSNEKVIIEQANNKSDNDTSINKPEQKKEQEIQKTQEMKVNHNINSEMPISTFQQEHQQITQNSDPLFELFNQVQPIVQQTQQNKKQSEIKINDLAVPVTKPQYEQIELTKSASEIQEQIEDQKKEIIEQNAIQQETGESNVQNKTIKPEELETSNQQIQDKEDPFDIFEQLMRQPVQQEQKTSFKTNSQAVTSQQNQQNHPELKVHNTETSSQIPKHHFQTQQLPNPQTQTHQQVQQNHTTQIQQTQQPNSSNLSQSQQPSQQYFSNQISGQTVISPINTNKQTLDIQNKQLLNDAKPLTQQQQLNQPQRITPTQQQPQYPHNINQQKPLTQQDHVTNQTSPSYNNTLQQQPMHSAMSKQQMTPHQKQTTTPPMVNSNNSQPQTIQNRQSIQPSSVSTVTVQQQHQQQQQKDITIDKSQFSTVNTETYRNQQTQQQQMQMKLDPSSIIKITMQNFFRKSLLANKSVLFEDSNIQIGVISDYQGPPHCIMRMRLFFGNKSQMPLQSIRFSQAMQPIGFKLQQSKDLIPMLPPGQQDMIEIALKVETYQLSIPVFALTYTLNDVNANPIPVRLPMILLKLCNAANQLDAQTFIFKWNFEYGSESEVKQTFNIDFNQCRSLSQLKEVLQFGKQTFTFVDGVEQQKNILCGATQFVIPTTGMNQSSPSSVQTLTALIKIVITANGQNCEIIGRSSEETMEYTGPGGQNPNASPKFIKFIISNILEMIAI